MKTPFFDGISSIANSETRFFVPGHKGNPAAIPAFKEILKYDLTEVHGACDLSAPSSILAQSEQNMSAAFGSGATLYSASGSTSCILAMITMFAGISAGQNIVMLRNCHISAIRALAFTGLRPVWVLPQNNRANPQDIEHALRTSGARLVYITSPTYEGQLSDIQSISRICKKYSAALLVDNAHGAYLKFLEQDLHPISLGADACSDSAHKTLPCLTPAALLHLKSGQNATAARTALNLYSSTSPSYLVLQSLDLAAGLLLESPPDFDKTAKICTTLREKHSHLFSDNCDEALKLVLCPQKAGYSTTELNEALIESGILPELCTAQNIVLMPSPYNTARDFELLESVLDDFSQKKEPLATLPPLSLLLPQAACSVRQAVFSESEHIPLAKALHRIAAGTNVPCPPGIPVLVPGERINENSLRFLAHSGIASIDVLK